MAWAVFLPPFAHVVSQGLVNRQGNYFGRLHWCNDYFQRFVRSAADVAVAAGLPLGRFAEVAADLQLAALFGIHEIADVEITLPGTVSFLLVGDLLHEVRQQGGVLFLP